jgi:hypothetical protein
LRSTTRSLAVAACLLIVLALSGVAAGATQTSSPKKWVSTFCGSVFTWEQAVNADAARLTKEVNVLKQGGTVNRAAARTKLVGFMGELVTATNRMIGKVKAVGAPDVKNGSKIQKGVIDAFGQVAKAFKQGQGSARTLPISTQKAFQKAAINLGKTIQATANRVAAAFSALQKYSSKPLDDAARHDKQCLKLGG